MKFVHILYFSGLLLLAGLIGPTWAQVVPLFETARARGFGDAADDAAIWVNRSHPARSTIIGMSKANQGGIHVYDLEGRQLQFLALGSIGAVDVRYDFLLNGAMIDIVLAIKRSDDTLLIFQIDRTTGVLVPEAISILDSFISVYGACLYRSSVTNNFYAFVAAKNGRVDQWRLYDDGKGRMGGDLVRTFDIGGQAEGCVADDDLAAFYIAEEDVGIWRYAAESAASAERVMVDPVGAGGHLAADVEGLALYYTDAATGYLIASSQGDSTFAVYERQGCNDYLTSFYITDNSGSGIDGCEKTDGLDAVSAPLNSDFPLGLLVAHDNKNSGASSSNYKLVSWEGIAALLSEVTPTHLTLNSITIKAASPRTELSDAFNFSGFLGHLSADEIGIADTVTIRLQNREPAASVFRAEIPTDSLTRQGNRYAYRSSGTGIRSFEWDALTGQFSLTAKAVNLAGLKSPVDLSIQIGEYHASAILYDRSNAPDNFNGALINKGVPLSFILLSGWQDALRADSCKRKRNQLSVTGAIARADTSAAAIGHDLIFTIGDESLVLPGDSLVQSKNKLSFYTRVEGDDAAAAKAVIDLVKCSFKLTVRNAAFEEQEFPVLLHLHWGSFDEYTVLAEPK